jgi:predicted enzyme related to lactoylglutathione lyase
VAGGACGKARANRKALRRWHEVPKQSALEQQQETAMNSPTTLGPIGQIARSVRNIAEAQAWYGSALGIPHLYSFGKLAFFDCGGIRLMLTEEAQAPAAESILYLRVADISAAHEQLRARGVEFISAPHMIHKHADGTEEWMAFFKDPEGRTLAIMSQAARPS